MNFLRDTLNSARHSFIRQVACFAIWSLGFILLASVDWRVAVGFYLINLGVNVTGNRRGTS